MKVAKRGIARKTRHYLQALTAAESLVSASGFTLDHVAILRLLSEREPLSSSEIACSLRLSPAMVTRCMDKLSALELVRVSLNETDLRKNSFRLQSRARAILFEIENGLGPEVSLNDGLRAYQTLEFLSRVAKENDSNIPSGVNFQGWRVLLAGAEGVAGVGTLGQRCGIAQPRASIAISGLVQKGLLVRAPEDAQDARQRLYQLTAEGIALVKQIVEMIETGL